MCCVDCRIFKNIIRLYMFICVKRKKYKDFKERSATLVNPICCKNHWYLSRTWNWSTPHTHTQHMCLCVHVCTLTYCFVSWHFKTNYGFVVNWRYVVSSWLWIFFPVIIVIYIVIYFSYYGTSQSVFFFIKD